MEITTEGQLAVGDTIQIEGRSACNSRTSKVVAVLSVNGAEQVITDRWSIKLRSFVTSEVLSGRSWVKSVTKIC